ncbi:hypothetical protein QQF64_017237 [Cirrhinus molitorella]|uniref:Gypsy retrotransposon integrase-like protein 1 n=1 Tax=Cirrhinus molitorella TaxID=172907 RepID=A0ABR3LI26_9TELE
MPPPQTQSEVRFRFIPDYSERDQSDLISFYIAREELTVLDDRSLLLRGHLFNTEHLNSHEGHQGLVKTKQLLREKVWFPGKDRKVEQLISACIPCQASTVHNKHQLLQMSELPEAGIPKIRKSYNGPPFSSPANANFTTHLGIHYCKIAPYWPQANSRVERFMTTLK